MFTVRSDRKLEKLNLDKREDLSRYEELISDPAVTILDKKVVTESEVTYEGDMKTEVSQTYYVVEYERCSL